METVKYILEKIISIVPYIGKWRKVFLKHSIPGHFYSPITDLEWVKSRQQNIYDLEKPIKDIDLNLKFQSQLAKDIEIFYPGHVEFLSTCSKYTHENIYYTGPDALVAHYIISKYKPRKILEVGSGYSSALMYEINKYYFNNTIEIVNIEPNPERLYSVLEKQEINLLKFFVQDVKLTKFEELQVNDILFIDSSHVSKTDSDLNFLIFNVLPILNRGVLIHFHDIFYPFEYPLKWLEKGYSWNESFLLRAFLMNNEKYEIIFWNSYMDSINKFGDIFKPQLNNNTFCSSLWIKKIG